MNYIGSKHSLLNFLIESIDEATGVKNSQGMVFADLFSGTSAVGNAFKRKGYKVLSNDIQYYGYVMARHYIGNVPPVTTKYFDCLNELKGEEGFVYNNFCLGSGSNRSYFSDNNGLKCDAIRIKIEELRDEAKINNDEYYFYLASLINSIDTYANTASVYGAYLKNIKKSAAKEFELKALPIIDGVKGEAFNQDINQLIREVSGDILYLDPPYNARQYSSNYHVLETIAQYDSPELRGKTGLRADKTKNSLFCSKRSVEQVFEDVVKNANFKYIFLSYNNEGLMSLDQIKNIMQKYGEYKLYTKEYRRFRADKEESRNHKADKTFEYLHCLKVAV